MPDLRVWAIRIVNLNPSRGNETIYATKWINGFKSRGMILAKGDTDHSVSEELK